MNRLIIDRLDSGFVVSRRSGFSEHSAAAPTALDALAQTMTWLGFSQEEIAEVGDLLDEEVYVLTERGQKLAEQLLEARKRAGG